MKKKSSETAGRSGRKTGARSAAKGKDKTPEKVASDSDEDESLKQKKQDVNITGL